MSSTDKSAIDTILELKGANREAKSYAFLYAAFRKTEVSSNPVRDALDCLIPFIAPFSRDKVGQQVTATHIQEYMKESYGFDLPLYAIDQLFSSLISSGIVEYNRKARLYTAKATDSRYDVARAEIEVDFEEISDALKSYAEGVGYTIAPTSGDWGAALIKFLKNRTDKKLQKIVNIKNALVDSEALETTAVGNFISHLHNQSPRLFEKLLNIFMGTLIEDFITTIAEVGDINPEKPVTVFYDTSLLMRQMGCSEKDLRRATEELTRYLQDLGFNILYLSGNEAEVANIIDTIIYIKDSGKELEGETAAAIAAGDVTITKLRTLQNTIPEHLARSNIFPAEDLEKNATENAKYQINEIGFSEYLKQVAKDAGRAYGHGNSQNDASYLGTVMRLRRNKPSRDLADCGYIFVTSNRFLAATARRYLIKEGQIRPQHVPPILAVGQIATIAWLLKDHTLPPEQAGRQLLSNCYAAVRPDAEWFGFFREGIEAATESTIEEYAETNRNNLTLQAARRIAQEESFSNSIIVRQLNMAEILARAEADQNERELRLEEASQERIRSFESQLEFERTVSSDSLNATIAKAEQEKRQAVLKSGEAARKAALQEARTITNEFALSRSRSILTAGKYVSLFAFFTCTAYTLYLQFAKDGAAAFWLIPAFLALISVVSFADTLKLSPFEPIIRKTEVLIARGFGYMD